jgi:phosphohistidine phosphatase SixA
MIRRPRTSTLALATIFALTLALYLAVRPDPPPPTRLVPAVEVPATTERPTPADTPTTRTETTTKPPTTATTPSTTGASETTTTEAGELLLGLRRGGYVIYFRHGATDDADDTDLQNLENCETQRNLTEEGRAQAREIGRAFNELQVPVGPVRSSAFCRTREFANLAFGRVEESVELTSLPEAGGDAEEERRVEALREMLGMPPPEGQNTVLVGHLFNTQRAAEIALAEGDAAVVRPAEDGFTVVATVSPEEWQTLG